MAMLNHLTRLGLLALLSTPLLAAPVVPIESLDYNPTLTTRPQQNDPVFPSKGSLPPTDPIARAHWRDSTVHKNKERHVVPTTDHTVPDPWAEPPPPAPQPELILPASEVWRREETAGDEATATDTTQEDEDEDEDQTVAEPPPPAPQPELIIPASEVWRREENFEDEASVPSTTQEEEDDDQTVAEKALQFTHLPVPSLFRRLDLPQPTVTPVSSPLPAQTGEPSESTEHRLPGHRRPGLPVIPQYSPRPSNKTHDEEGRRILDGGRPRQLDRAQTVQRRGDLSVDETHEDHEEDPETILDSKDTSDMNVEQFEARDGQVRTKGSKTESTMPQQTKQNDIPSWVPGHHQGPDTPDLLTPAPYVQRRDSPEENEVEDEDEEDDGTETSDW